MTMTNKRITESQLRNKTASLRDYIDQVTAEEQSHLNEWGSAKDWGAAVGGGLGAAAGGLAGGVPGAALGPAGAATGAVVGGAAGHEAGSKLGAQAGEWLGNAAGRVGKAWDAATGSWGKTSPQAAAPAGTTKPGAPAKPGAGGKADPAVLKIQNDLIAQGAKIKADGIMGPATAAAQAQFAKKPPAAAAAPQVNVDSQQAQMLAAQTAGMDEPAPQAAAPAGTTAPVVNPHIPKPDTSKQDAWAKLSPEQQKWLGGADPTDPAILARMRSAVPDAPAAAVAKESVTYSDENSLARIMQIANHRR